MIGDNIRKILKEKRMSSRELAKKIGISETHMSYLLNGKRKPSFELLDELVVSKVLFENKAGQIMTLYEKE